MSAEPCRVRMSHDHEAGSKCLFTKKIVALYPFYSYLATSKLLVTKHRLYTRCRVDHVDVSEHDEFSTRGSSLARSM